MADYVQKIKLPSGIVLEISIPGPSYALHVCPHCEGELVYPTSWKELEEDWHIHMRCPDCHAVWDGEYDHTDVLEFDRILNDGTDRLIDDYEHLAKANMEDYLSRFSKALDQNAILPEDF